MEQNGGGAVSGSGRQQVGGEPLDNGLMIKTGTFGICTIMRNEARYIEEWLAFHLLQGAIRILVYDNGSTDGTLDILARAASKSPILVVDWSDRPGPFDDVQRAAYMDGAARLSGSCDLVAFIDADEFLHAGAHRTVTSVLAAVPADVSAIAVNQRVFGSSGLLDYEPGLVTSRFVRCTEHDYVENRWFKTVARPSQIVSFDSVHSVAVTSGRYVMNDLSEVVRETDHPGLANRVGDGELTLNHYMLRSLEEFRHKQRRWESRPDMQSRYSMGYFTGREGVANLAVDDRLVGWADRVKAAIAELHEPPRPSAVQERTLSPLATRLLSERLLETASPEPQVLRRSGLVARLIGWFRKMRRPV